MADERVWLTSVPANAEKWRAQGRNVRLLTQEEARSWWRDFRRRIVEEASSNG